MIGVLLLLIAAFLLVDTERASIEEDVPDDIADRDLKKSPASGIDRGETRSIKKSAPDGPIYLGPNSLEEWTVQPIVDSFHHDAWSFDDKKLSSLGSGIAAQEFDLPDRVKISLHLAWPGSLRTQILFLSDQGNSIEPNNTLNLVFQRRFVYLRRRFNDGVRQEVRILGQANVEPFESGNQALLEFYLDRETGLFAFYVDGRQYALWSSQDSEGIPQFGSWIQFVSEDHFPVHFSQIKIEQWKGNIPGSRLLAAQHFEPDPKRIAELSPPGRWAPAETYRRERARILAKLNTVLAAAAPSDRIALEHAAIRSNVEAQARYNEAFNRLPEAKHAKDQPGFVINPFTGETLDVRGVPGATRIWDPRTARGDQVFRIPYVEPEPEPESKESE